MSLYNGPPRAGARGGAAEFSWENVKADKDRDYYLGHSVKASVGRWQKNRDILWYTRDAKDNQQTALADEIAAVKQREADLMAEALGLKPKMVRTTVTPRLDKQEMDALLKQGSGAAEEGGEADPDRVHGLGFTTAPLGGPSEAVHETLQGVGMGTGATAAIPGPLPAAGAAGASTSYPPPPPMGLMTAQQLSELAKQDKRAAKAAKKAQKAEKKAKKKEHKKHKKQKSDKHRSRSRSSSRSPSPSRSRSRSRGREDRPLHSRRPHASPSRHVGGDRAGRHSSMDRADAHRQGRHEESGRVGRRGDSMERGKAAAAAPLARGDVRDSYAGSRHHAHHRDGRGPGEDRHGGRTRHDSPDSPRLGGGEPRHSSRHDAERREQRRSPVHSSRQHGSPKLERGGGSRRRHDSP